ncbi:hypothetical protein OG552_21150 [Streptomyces sp. NBC_01476]|uniref:hypothetical protein n=1 Tax=Streptomyces sp. NBC_01476 TaxID=2903881 RepID=UPI002E2F65AA|nr:hypothetical protein [Streptomyces sp. NBC_01476]
MITEPEMAGDPQPGPPADVLSGAGEPPPAGRAGARWRPWLWALGGTVAASAVWAGVLHSPADDHASAPDLHGYHLTSDPCTTRNLQPLTGVLSTRLYSDGALITRGPALTKLSCTLISLQSGDDGPRTDYTISLSVTLHEKTDPRTEFEDTSRFKPPIRVPAHDPGGDYISLYPSDDAAERDTVTRPLGGLGDRAFLSTSANRRTLEVLHGGAVFTLDISSSIVLAGTADPSGGSAAPPADGAGVDAALPATMRHLMSVLSR